MADAGGGQNVLVLAGSAADQLVAALAHVACAFSPAADGAGWPTWQLWTKYYSADVALHSLAAPAPDAGAELLPSGCALVLAFDLSAASSGAGGPSQPARAAWARLLDEREQSGEPVETRVCVGFAPQCEGAGAEAEAEAARLSDWALEVGAEYVRLVEGERPQPQARERLGAARVVEILECHPWPRMRTPPLPPAGGRGQGGAPPAPAGPESSDHTSHARGNAGTLGDGGETDGASARPGDALLGPAGGGSDDDAAAAELAALSARAARPRVRAALKLALNAARAECAQLAAHGPAGSGAAADAAEYGRLEGLASRPRTLEALRALRAGAEAEAAAFAAAPAAAAASTGARGPAPPAASSVADAEAREADARVQQLMASAGLGEPREEAGTDDGDDEEGGGAGLEKLMAQMARLRDHGGRMDSADRRERAAELALEAARLCGFADGEGESSSDEGERGL